METLKLSKTTVELLLEILAATSEGRAGLALGQDIAKLNSAPKLTENQILEEHALQKVVERGT